MDRGTKNKYLRKICKKVWLLKNTIVALCYKALLYMAYSKEHLNDLHDIKQMMERSSRFISLSGWSGIAAGICALVGAYFAQNVIADSKVNGSYAVDIVQSSRAGSVSLHDLMGHRLFIIAVLTFVAAFVSAFIFTYIRSRKNNTLIWSATSRRLMVNVGIPMIAGGVYLLKLVENGTYGLVAPGCLIFYGLALINGSKYTLGEIRYLGYCEIFLGIISCWFIGLGLYFWAVGFGILHIIYGTLMWYKYERNA
ncbi:MAG: hypothetical protein JWQ40_2613 [Segetibacter sp.]|nr:hypothetical protein [Segetibacter sp.]